MSALQARRASILAAIDAMPGASNPTRRRLAFVTTEFVKHALFEDAVRYGWSDRELFSVCPFRCAQRPDKSGIVSFIALSSLAQPKLIEIAADTAVVECGRGHRSHLTHRRTGRLDALGCLWWESPELGAAPPTAIEVAA